MDFSHSFSPSLLPSHRARYLNSECFGAAGSQCNSLGKSLLQSISSQLAKHARETGSSGNKKGVSYGNLWESILNAPAGRKKYIRTYVHIYTYVCKYSYIDRKVFISFCSTSNIIPLSSPCAESPQIFLFSPTDHIQLLSYYCTIHSKINLENCLQSYSHLKGKKGSRV